MDPASTTLPSASIPVYEGGRSCTITDEYLKHQLETVRPKRVVDFGAGAGRLGRLCREVLKGEVHLTAVEGFPATVARLRENGPYDQVDQALLQEWTAKNRATFDLAMFGDVLEHVTRNEAFQALDAALTFAPNVLVNIPLRNLLQDEVGGNILEEHRAYFTERCFDRRYVFREKHVVMPDPGYEMLNGWIIGRRRRGLKSRVRERILLHGGRRGRAILERLGFDTYPRMEL
jgi:trans-aconitate methyltransferase